MGGGNLQKTCAICRKTMRGDTLKIHMKHHEKNPYSIYHAETHRSGTGGEIKNVDEAETNRRVTSSEKCINLEMLEEKNCYSNERV